MAQITLTEKEYQSMKDEIDDMRVEIQRYREMMKDTEQEMLKRRLKENAFALANLYLKTVFKKLGFTVQDNISRYFDPLQIDQCTYLPDKWYLDPDSIKLTIEASLTNEMRQAFLRIGVLPKEEKLIDPLEVETSIHN